jgi:tyrosine-protein kinase Fer
MGIVMWETFSYGKTPYPALNNSETLEQVNKGYRLPAPDNCPEDIYKMMVSCWQKEPSDRPSFKQLYTSISGLLEAKDVSYNKTKATDEALYQN